MAVDERSMRIDERSSGPRFRFRRRLWSALALGVAAVSIVSLLQRELLGTRLDSGALESILRDIIAACAWVPIGFMVFRLARRVPLDRADLKRALAVHVPGIPAAALALNLLIAAGWMTAGVWPATGSFGGVVADGTLRHLHVNALIYLLIVTVASARARGDSLPKDDGKLATAGDRDPARDGAAEGRGDAVRDAAGSGATDLRIAVPHRGRTLLLRAGEIDWIEASGDYASLHVGERSYLLAKPMGALASELKGSGFLRVHRSAIVNLERVSELRGEPSGNATLILSDGTEVGISRRRRGDVEATLTARGTGGSESRRSV